MWRLSIYWENTASFTRDNDPVIVLEKLQVEYKIKLSKSVCVTFRTERNTCPIVEIFLMVLFHRKIKLDIYILEHIDRHLTWKKHIKIETKKINASTQRKCTGFWVKLLSSLKSKMCCYFIKHRCEPTTYLFSKYNIGTLISNDSAMPVKDS